MATERFYQLEGMVIAHVEALADAADFDVSPGSWPAPNVIIDTYIVEAACDVKYLADPAGDFSAPNTSFTLDSFGSNGISEGNATPLMRNRTAIRITNTSGGSADYILVGEALSGGD